MAASPVPVRCGFCLSERGKKDKYRSLHPSVPQSLLEEDTPPLVCTPCYNFLYSEYARKCGDDRAASDSESDEETSQKTLERRYPNALSANNGLPPAKRLYMLLMAKLFTKSAKLPSLSVDRFSLKGIPYTSDRSFAFDPSKVTFGVRLDAMGENAQSSVASVEGRLPWLTSLLTKNGVQPDTADVAVRKRSRLSWCNPKKPCVYCLNHIDAVASGLSRGTRRKSCLCMPASWKSIDEKTRSEARDAAFSALERNEVSPLGPAPGLDSEEGASTPPPQSPTQESSKTKRPWQENRGDSDRESEMALEAVKKVHIKNEADDDDMDHQAGGKEQPDSSRGSNVVGVSRPAKRLRSGLRGDQKPRAVEESAAATGERSDAAEPDEADGDEAVEKATTDGGNAAERNDAEAPQGKPAKVVRKRRRGLSAELRSLQLWSHWEEEEEEDSTNDNENEESDNKKEERKRKKHKENEKWDDEEEEEQEQQTRRGKLRRSAKSSDTEAKKDEQQRRTRWAKRDSESEEAEEKQLRTTRRKEKQGKVDEKMAKKEREEERKERRESELRRSLRSREEREKAKLEREAKLRAEEAKRKLEQERREQEKKKRDQKKTKTKIEEEKEEEEMRRGRKEEERRGKRKKSTSQLKTATSTNSTTSNGPPKEEDTAVAALLSLISENAAPKTPAALPALDEATMQKLSASMSSRPSLATSAQFEEIVLDDDEDDDNADDRHHPRKAARPGNVAAVADPHQTHLPSLASLFLGSSLRQASIAGVPAPPPSLPHVPLPPSPSGLRAASSTVAAKPPSQARASPRPSTPPTPTPTPASAPTTQSAAHYAGVGQALPPAPPGYPYATAVANAARAMTPEHAYAAQLTAAHMAHLNPQLLLQLLQQSLHFPSGSQAAAAHAAQALMYAPLLNLPPGAAAQFRPPTTSYPSAPPAPPAATRTHQAAPPRTWPPSNHHK